LPDQTPIFFTRFMKMPGFSRSGWKPAALVHIGQVEIDLHDAAEFRGFLYAIDWIAGV
jgi:hypothetical protein